MPKVSKRVTLRWTLAIISLTVFLAVVPYTIYKYATTSQFLNKGSTVVIRDRNYNDLTDGAIQAKLMLSNNLFQATLLVTAALTGLLIAKKGEAGFLFGRPRLRALMFICASILLLLSFGFNALYINEISYIYSIAGNLI